MTLPLMLVDGNNLLVRAVEATRNAQMTGADGVSTAALVAFASTLSRQIRRFQPYEAVVCWDGGYDRRKAILKTYKAQRDHTPNDYRLQSKLLAEEFLRLSAIPQVRVDGEEADDLIAAYWRRADRPVIIVSSDKDLLQLLGPNPNGHLVTQLRLTNRGDELWDLQQVESSSGFGCGQDRLSLAMAIAGDKSDNVDGVPRFGIKTAVKQMDRVGWDLASPDLHESLQGHMDLIRRNIDLIDLRNSPVRVPPRVPPFNPVRPGEPRWTDLVEFCDRHGLRKIIKQSATSSLWG